MRAIHKRLSWATGIICVATVAALVTLVIVAVLQIGEGSAKAEREPVPTPDIAAWEATSAAIRTSESSRATRQTLNATAQALSRPVETVSPLETAGSVIEIGGEPFKLPNDVYVIGVAPYGTCLIPGCVPFPKYILGKGDSKINVSLRTGEIGVETIVDSQQDPFAKLKSSLDSISNEEHSHVHEDHHPKLNLFGYYCRIRRIIERRY